MNSEHPTGKLTLALWKPGWHRLDQSVRPGDSGPFYFFSNSPGKSNANGQAFELQFYNELMSEQKNMQRLRAKVISITHPDLGPIQSINTDGLDYSIIAANGHEFIVNAEEEPGTTYDEPIAVTRWEFEVLLSDVSTPLGEVV
ncbi:MAG: hypothetical protein R3C03_00275 [Pirellulaceae bacterium]